MHKLFLCLRYLRKRRIAFFGIAAVTLCVALLIVVTSLFEGFITAFESHQRRAWGDVMLSPPRAIRDYRQLTTHLEQAEGVAHAVALIEWEALLYLGHGDIRPVRLIGMQPAKWQVDEGFRDGMLLQSDKNAPAGFDLSAQADKTARQWLSQRLPREVRDTDMPVGAIVGIGLLGRPDELTDEYDRKEIIDRVTHRESPLIIITSRPSAQEQATIEKVQGKCWPVDVVQTGLHDADTKFVYLPFDYLRELIAGGAKNKHKINALLQITVDAGWSAEKVLPGVWRRWQSFATDELGWPQDLVEMTIVETTSDRLGFLMREIRKQLWLMQILLGLICVVAALLVFVILFMIVMHKKRDIGIVRAIGSSRSGIAGLFLAYGAAVGITGAGLGLVLGMIATRNISVMDALLTKLLGFKMWKSGVYLFSEIPNEVAWGSVGWILLAGIAAAIVGALLPAIRAARMQPVDTLRYE